MIHFQTNTGAMTALQMLGGTNQSLQTTHNQISTGQTVNGPQDNAALWAISELMNSDLSGYSGLSDALSLGEATLGVASAGAEFVTDTLNEMKQIAILGSSGVVDFSKVEAQLAQKTDQINSVISSSQFNGANLLRTDVDGSGASAITVAASLDKTGGGTPTLSNIQVDSLDLESSPNFDINGRTAVTDAASARTALDEIEGFLQFAVDGAASLGAAASRISEQQDVIARQALETKKGLSGLIDTNIEESAAKLKALEVQQQLGLTSLSIANSAPTTLLALY